MQLPARFACSILFAMTFLNLNAHASALPEMTVPQSFGMQIKTNAPEDLEAIHTLGLKFVRRGFHWEGIEKTKGVYDFSGMDPFMADARKNGVRVLGVLAFANKLYGPVREAEGRAAFAKYAAALAEHFKNDNVLWEVWNEPNTMTFWGKHGKKGNTEAYAIEYTALVKETVPAMKKADPNCFVMAGSVSCLWEPSFLWTDACFKHGIMESGIDAWSVHPYGSHLPEENFSGYERVRKIMAENKVPADFPMLNSERGYPVKKAEGWAGGPESMSLPYQSWHLVRQYLTDQLAGIRVTIWYEWRGDEFGIFKDKDNVRPGYTACKTLLEQLDGYKLSKRLPQASDNDYVLLYEKASGEQKLVAWTAPHSGESPDKTVNHDIDISTTATGTVEGSDLLGKKTQLTVTDGKLKVSLSGSPQYIKVK